ncbi:MAG: 4-(cytidine 5'-diphospho)-2-C-methyl-D-erythritol kinase [Solirubrobacterales bacterium]|nr:4-(cytidine 5'-diphospho)-2-C-methyl-D-erythritol kinase [Solirubrobacterales bacterium]
MILTAPAKLNLCLYLGPTRDDGLHEIASLFEPLALADQIEVVPASADEVVCEGVEGHNLAERALAALREQGWGHPPLRIEIEKRIPVAAGLGGGSADAAAVLRLARGEVEGLERIAASLGADVPSQLDPRPSLVTGAGEILEPIDWPGSYQLVLVPLEAGLSAAEVYAEADRLGLGRPAPEMREIERRLREVTRAGDPPLAYPELLVNDLQPAAVSLRPEIEDAFAALRAAGAAHTMVTGSGPTAVGLFELIEEAIDVESLKGLRSSAIVTAPSAGAAVLEGDQ